MDRKGLKELLEKIKICQEGKCLICGYQERCMDDLIDDCAHALATLYVEYYLEEDRKND